MDAVPLCAELQTARDALAKARRKLEARSMETPVARESVLKALAHLETAVEALRRIRDLPREQLRPPLWRE